MYFGRTFAKEKHKTSFDFSTHREESSSMLPLLTTPIIYSPILQGFPLSSNTPVLVSTSEKYGKCWYNLLLNPAGAVIGQHFFVCGKGENYLIFKPIHIIKIFDVSYKRRSKWCELTRDAENGFNSQWVWNNKLSQIFANW